MKRTAASIGLLGFALLALLAVSPATAKEEEDFKDLKVDVLKPFEKADPDKVGISEVKAEQLKKADHVIVEGVDKPPRIKDEADLDDFDEPKIKVDKVKPFDKRDVFSRETLPLAGEKEFAGALEFQDLDDTLKGRLKPDKGNARNSSDAKVVENVFQFKHVAGNDMVGAPLFNQALDPRTVTVQKGDAKLDTNGVFHADLSGVQVDQMVQPGFQMGAVIFCGDGREVHRTGLFPLDELGNMKIEESMVFPADCVAPAVTFVGPEGMMTGVAGGFPAD